MDLHLHSTWYDMPCYFPSSKGLPLRVFCHYSLPRKRPWSRRSFRLRGRHLRRIPWPMRFCLYSSSSLPFLYFYATSGLDSFLYSNDLAHAIMLGKWLPRRLLYAIHEKLRYRRSNVVFANVHFCGASVSRANRMV